MKTIFIIIIFSIVLCCCVSNATKKGDKENNFKTERTDTVNFNTEVMPFLQKKCSPCHFPDGKMYDKMPFDNSVTILHHETGILKRIKDQPEVTLIRQFVLQHNKAN